MIRALHHVQLTVPKGAEAEARRFYCDHLGLQEVQKPDPLKSRGGFWLQLGPIQIHVGEEDGVDRTKTKAHLAYEVSDLAALRALVTRLNLPLTESIPIPGMDRFEFRDPFGNRVEVLQRTA